MDRKGLKMTAGLFSVMAVVLVVALLLGGNNVVEAAGDVDNASVTVSIGTITIVDVTPEKMNFGTTNPGTRLYQFTDPDNGIQLSQIQIENLGSTSITDIHFNVTQPSTNPFGTGVTENYDAGNWLLLKRTSDTAYAYVDRVEWNSTYKIVYLEPGLPPGWKTYGKIRMGNREYFWTINGTAAYCNTTGNTLVIGQTPHNESQTGTINLASGDIVVGNIGATTDPNWGIVDGITIEGVSYCVAVSADCSTLRIYKWNTDAPGAGDCTADSNFLSSNLAPGDSVIADVALYVPYGVPEGTPTTGYLTVIASAA